MTPLDKVCPHIDAHGFSCEAKIGYPCVSLLRSGEWEVLTGFHEERVDAPPAPLATLDLLSPTERRVVALVANGHNRESIANQLEISLMTAQRHLSTIYKKLGINSMLELAVWYFQTYWQPKVVR